MEYLLKELEIIRKEYKMLADRNEKFNIFSALHKDHDERRLHSRFISVLLQPRGNHGKNEIFLTNFLSLIEEEIDFVINKNTLIYPKESDKRENSNIDILIINRLEKECIIIENKIYAGDSNLSSGGQIERYIKHAINEEKIPLEKVHVIYLSIDGHDPSEECLGCFKEFKNIHSHGYEDLILPWLEKCLKEVAEQPFLRESIIQYKKLIQDMTGNSSSLEERLAYKKLIGSSEQNMNSTKKLMDNFKHVKWHSVYDFWLNLQTLIEADNQCKLIKPFDKDDSVTRKKNNCITDLTHYEEYRKGQRNKQICIINFKISIGITISVRFSANDGHFYLCIPKEKNKNSTFTSLIEELNNEHEEYTSSDRMLLFKIFNNDLKFNDFSIQETFDLISTTRNKELVNQTFSEIKELIDRIMKKC